MVKCIAGRIGMAASAVLLLTTVLVLPTEATTPPPLTGVRSVTSSSASTCSVLTSGKVDCWGNGHSGQLGNGTFYTTGDEGSAVPVAVKGVGGAGTLGGVASLTGATDDGIYCALLTSGKVDCWGHGYSGELGDGTLHTTGKEGSAVPVAVKGVGGAGTLGGVAGLVSDSTGYCALLTSGEVDCWGSEANGDLGNGSSSGESAVPVAVTGLRGEGTLAGVARLTSDDSGYCALLTSRKVDCWGYGGNGELGNGGFYSDGGSDVPVAVVSGAGTLGGVARLTSETLLANNDGGYCALLVSGKVECWGGGSFGELGNGTFYTTGHRGSAVPVAVKAVGGAGTLGAVASITNDGGGYCARLTSAKVDCWGSGADGDLGNGTMNGESAVPVAVKGLGGAGTLGGVASLTSDNAGGGSVTGYCARLTSDKVDCWGRGFFGELGNGMAYNTPPYGSAVPVNVKGVDGAGTLGGVANLSTGSAGFYCARLTSKEVDCWGAGPYGELGNGTFYTNGNEGSAVPVAVLP